MSLTLPVGSILFIDTGTDANNPIWTKLSEHNRSPVSVDTYRHEQTARMANGSLRKIHIADKKTISTSWDMLPSFATMTVDGGYGAQELRSFYLNKGKGSFKVKVSYNGVSARDEIFTAFFQSASFNVMKRNVKMVSGIDPQEFWNVDISLEEI